MLSPNRSFRGLSPHPEGRQTPSPKRDSPRFSGFRCAWGWAFRQRQPACQRLQGLHRCSPPPRHATARAESAGRSGKRGGLESASAGEPQNPDRRTRTDAVSAGATVATIKPSQEGEPIKLAEMRTMTFRDRKILAGSTPIFDFGPITRLYAESDRRIYECLCPECGGFSEIEWAQITWPEGQPDKAALACPQCGCLIEERFKPQMVAQGRWRVTAPEVTGHAGFRINCLVSPHHNARWGKLAAEFLSAKRAPETLQVFTNTILGQAWKSEGEDLDEHELFARREPFHLDSLPPDVLWITAGVDCQDDRLEVVLMGHTDSDWLVLDHRVFWGPIDGEGVWQDLDSLLKKSWQHPNGGTIRIDACAVDSSDGGHLQHVMAYCKPRFERRVVPIKGVPGFSRPVFQRSGTKGQHLWLMGVDAAKSALFARLTRSQGIRFGQALQPIYFEQLTSERRVVRYVRGKPEARFERIKGKRAETLDATVYALAVRQIIGQREDLRAAELASAAAPRKAATVVKSKWLGG
ncbi:terminase gpA endonuclease subunit [Rhodobacter capsulatus]|uniref:terminase gpA endonuclease subunit n=1 Tax=Rhodobacter capsulatus TaxID=1061 RepID=UPI004028C4E0